jgi:DNA-binding transcriptional ArsR family regulator
VFIYSWVVRFVGNAEKDIQCECREIHQKEVESIIKNMPSYDTLYNLGELFKALGDSTRMKIIYSLFENEICVCDIAEMLGMSQSAISHQLRVLKQARLVKHRKEGKTVYYSLDDEHVKEIFDQGFLHINERIDT